MWYFEQISEQRTVVHHRLPQILGRRRLL